MRYPHLRVFLIHISLILCAALGLAPRASALPEIPVLPDPAALKPYREPDNKAQLAVIRRLIKDYEQFRTDVTELVSKQSGNAQKTAQGQYRLQTPDGRQMLYVTEKNGSVTALAFYVFSDLQRRVLDPRRSCGVEWFSKTMIFKNKENANLGFVQDGKDVRLDAFGNMFNAESVYKVWWGKEGQVLREEKTPVRQLQAREIKLASTAFLKACDPAPYPGAIERPADQDLANALDTAIRALGDDLREIDRQVKAGLMKLEANPAYIIGKTASANHQRIVAIVLSPDQSVLRQAAITLYEYSSEIREGALRGTNMTFNATGGLSTYALRTPQIEAQLVFSPDRKLQQLSVHWLSRSENRSAQWDGKGKVSITKEQPK